MLALAEPQDRTSVPTKPPATAPQTFALASCEPVLAAVAIQQRAVPQRSAPALSDGDGELTPREIAHRLGVSNTTVYYWIRHGQLQARHGVGGRLSVPLGPEIEQELRERVANSGHIKSQQAFA